MGNKLQEVQPNQNSPPNTLLEAQGGIRYRPGSWEGTGRCVRARQQGLFWPCRVLVAVWWERLLSNRPLAARYQVLYARPLFALPT